MGLSFHPTSVALAVDVSTDTTISGNLTTRQRFTADNITLTVTGFVEKTGNRTIQVNSKTGSTVIVESGATVSATTFQAIYIQGTTGATITNSGVIKVVGDSSSRGAISGNSAGTSNSTITNSGKIFVTGTGQAIQLGASSTVTNSGSIRSFAKDYAEAIKWLKLAAEQKFEAAQFKLELMHLNQNILN